MTLHEKIKRWWQQNVVGGEQKPQVVMSIQILPPDGTETHNVHIVDCVVHTDASCDAGIGGH